MTTPRIDDLNSYNNMIIGGNFDFWQRGTSFTAVANNAYTADRWQYTKVGAMVGNITRSTDVPTVAQSGFASQFSLLYTITTVDSSIAAGEVSLLNYKIEGSDYALIHGGQSARLQFWVKSSVTGTYGVALRNNAVNRSYVTTIAINAANTWERKTIDFTTDTAGTWLLDNLTGLQVSIVLDSGTDFRTSTLNSWQNGNFVAGSTQANFSATNGATFQLAQVMLVPGSYRAATNLIFKRAGRTIGDELRMCQRYYEKSYNVSVSPGSITSVGQISSASNADGEASIAVQFKEFKRATSTTLTIWNANTGASNSLPGAIDGLVHGESGYVVVVGAAGANAQQTAQHHYTADAEL